MTIEKNAEVVSAAPQPKKVSAEDKEAAHTAENMRAYFASRPKVSVKTKEDEWVQVNAYTFIIKKGERVEVPDDIARILEESGRI